MYTYITAVLSEDINARHANKKTELRVKNGIQSVNPETSALLIPLVIDLESEVQYTYEKSLIEASITQILLNYQPVRNLLSEEIQSITDYLLYSLQKLTSSQSWKTGLFHIEDREACFSLSEKFWNEKPIEYHFDTHERLAYIPVPFTIEGEQIFVVPPKINYYRIMYALLQPVSEQNKEMMAFECAVRTLSDVLTNFSIRQNNYEDYKTGKTDDFIHVDLINLLRPFGRAFVYWINSYSWRSGMIMGTDRYEIFRKIPFNVKTDSY